MGLKLQTRPSNMYPPPSFQVYATRLNPKPSYTRISTSRRLLSLELKQSIKEKMIKRRFYKEEHGDRNEASSDSSSSSSSSSDSEVEAEATDESEEGIADAKDTGEPEASTSSGYESEDSSEKEIDVNSPGFMNEDNETVNGGQTPVDLQLCVKHETGILTKDINVVADEGSVPADLPTCVLKCKSVYKCRICPRIVCLTEENMKAHLNSKRHGRSEKLLKENRLKAMLNSDGEIENQETPAEIHARIVALAQDKSEKKNKGRQRQRKRSRKKKEENASKGKKGSNRSTNKPAKKRRKNVD